MTIEHTPVRRPRLWLVIGAALAVIGIAVLWPLQQATRVCILIYPAPPGCGSADPRWMPQLGIAVILALFAAMVAVYLLVRQPRRILVILSAVILLVTLVSAAGFGISQAGFWDPYQPPVIVN